MAKNEVALSTKKLKEEGIEVRITQNDVIDLLVQEQVDLVVTAGRALIAEQKAWLAAAQAEWDKAVQDELAKLAIPKGLKVINVSKNIAGKTVGTNFLQESSHDRTGFVVFRTRYDGFYLEGDAKCSVKVTKTIGGIDLYGEMPLKFPFTHSEKVKKDLETIQKKVNSFVDSLPAQGHINEKEVARVLKNKFTKEVLKNVSPDLKKSLSSSMGLIL